MFQTFPSGVFSSIFFLINPNSSILIFLPFNNLLNSLHIASSHGRASSNFHFRSWLNPAGILGRWAATLLLLGILPRPRWLIKNEYDPSSSIIGSINPTSTISSTENIPSSLSGLFLSIFLFAFFVFFGFFLFRGWGNATHSLPSPKNRLYFAFSLSSLMRFDLFSGCFESTIFLYCRPSGILTGCGNGSSAVGSGGSGNCSSAAGSGASGRPGAYSGSGLTLISTTSSSSGV